MGELKVDPRDLLRVSESYRELGLRAQLISPQAATEVQRISESHGPMGYPTAVGIAAGMANAEGPLNAKVADFHEHAGRFEEHAATYSGQDQDNAKKYSTADLHTDKPRTPGSSGGGVQAVDWKPGDPRHRPYIAGPNGLGPSNPMDGSPKWMEIGPRSGNFVRSDELPGVKVQAPGQLGPPGFYDKVGDEHGWVELGPNTGVWVPDNAFPDMKQYPPGWQGLVPHGYEEYLPGSGIYVPRQSLIEEPLQPDRVGITHPAGI
jgi:hypothetical protein